MKRNFLSRCITTSVITLLGSQGAVSAQTYSSLDKWQEPYTPTRLQWLFTNLRGRGERTPCGVYDLKNVPLAFYEWQSPSAKDNQLVVSVFTRRDGKNSISDRNFCMRSVFEDLRIKALRLETSPPPVEFRHVRLNPEGRVLIYRCSVPAARTEVDLDMGRFESLCQ